MGRGWVCTGFVDNNVLINSVSIRYCLMKFVSLIIIIIIICSLFL